MIFMNKFNKSWFKKNVYIKYKNLKKKPYKVIVFIFNPVVTQIWSKFHLKRSFESAVAKLS